MIDHMLSKLDKVKSVKHNVWTACCPAHNDNNPSLQITVTDTGKILVKCWAGCEYEEIVSALGLQRKDFNPDLISDPITKQLWQQERIAKDIQHEKIILQIAKNDREEGKRLNQRDLDRERLAFERVRAYEKSHR